MLLPVATLAVALALLAPDGAPARAPDGAPGVSMKPCTVRGYSARCGTLLVPENRARPAGRKIGLRVVVVPSWRKPARPDAFTYLAGGPGAAASEMTDSVMSIWSDVNATRDILLVDQRGTGRSNPLSCSPPAEPIEKPARMRAFVRSCLRAAPGDMRLYGTRAAMDDLEAVRVALGYRQLNVYGTSYGATAAQVYLKRHPASVRTVVLDSGTAIDVSFYGRFAPNAEQALAQVAKRCAADRACSRAYPNWRGQLSALIRRWDARPVRNRKGETIDGAGLAGVIQGMLRDAGDAAEIPFLVSRTAAGNYQRLNEQVNDDGPTLQLMFWSIWCNEPWVGLGARGPWRTDFDGYTRSSIAFHRQACSYLPKRAEPASAWTSPRSRVPLLALAGGADPQDPISNLPRLKQLWPNGRAIVVPHLGHAIGQEGCLGELVTRFVARGSADGLDTRCVKKIKPPMFELP